MLYENEITIIFNLVNVRTRTVLGDSLTPHILRIPKDQITSDVDTFLETYTPLLKFIRKECVTWDDWENGSIEYYNIQEDIFENVIVKKVIPAPVDLQEHAREVILEISRKCLARFGIIDSVEHKTFEVAFPRIKEELQKKGLSEQSLHLYVLNHAEESVSKEVFDKIKEICKL